MGLLDGVLGSVLRGGGGGGVGGMGGLGGRAGRGGRSPVVNALLLALAAKALQSYMASRRQGGGPAAGPAAGPMGGGLGGMLGGAGGGLGGLGGILGSLGGAGALGGLLEQFNRRGLGPQAQSWVGTGANQPVEPAQLGMALDDNDIEQLAAETGLPKEEVLQEVAAALPDAIDQLTPDGRLPTEEELADLAAEYERQANSH